MSFTTADELLALPLLWPLCWTASRCPPRTQHGPQVGRYSPRHSQGVGRCPCSPVTTLGNQNTSNTGRTLQERQQYLYELLRHVRPPLLPPKPLATTEPRVRCQLVDAQSCLRLSSSRRALSAAGSNWYHRPQHTLLVMGGYSSDVFSYELSSGRWKSSTALPEDRQGAGAAVLDGRVYYVGGLNGRSQSSTFVFDVSRGSWSSGPSLTTARSYLSVAALDGVLYAVGGQDFTRAALSSAESLDPREGVWRAIGRMSTARDGVGVAALYGRLYAAGGDSGNEYQNTVERYEPSSGRWEPVESMSERREGATVSVVEDELYVAGGHNGSSPVQSVERYRAGSRWEPAPDMNRARWFAAAATHADRLYVAGGYNGDTTVSSVEVFSPSTGTWRELPAAMPLAQMEMSAVVVPWSPPHGDREFIEVDL